MFDSLPANVAELRGGGDAAALLDSALGWAKIVAAGEAQRLAVLTEFAVLRVSEADEETSLWTCDEWESLTAEIGAAFGISSGRAFKDLELGVAMRERFPGVAALFLRGEVSAWVVATIVHRTVLVTDPEALAAIDGACVEAATTCGWNRLSQYALKDAVDVWVDRHDPGAVRRACSHVQGRWFGVTHVDEKAGTAAVGGRMSGPGAALLLARLTAMAKAVCKDDPRTLAQRRVDALEALGADADQLACLCGSPTCPAAGVDPVAAQMVVHIYAEEAALDAESDPLIHGVGTGEDDDPATVVTGGVVAADATPECRAPRETVAPSAATVPGAEPAEATPAEATPAGDNPVPADSSTLGTPERSSRPPAGVIPGFGIVPAPLLAALIKAGATVRRVEAPGVEPETRYAPSVALAEFVRARYLTCCFPGCGKPATSCDLDHTIPWAEGGPTHASNLKPYCRKHHLVKTFHDGWSEVQHSDGTIVLTTPTGHTYTSRPGSKLLFPYVKTTTAPVRRGSPRQDQCADKTQMMPKRKRSRAKERAYRIAAERALNDAYVAERNAPPPF